MTTDRSDDFERGLANRRAVLGDAWVDRSLDGATDFNADFQSLITRYAWHDIWGRPGLDHETRRLLVLGMTMGMARWEEFELHCRAAVRGGVATEKIKETLLQGAIYCGVPAANTVFKIAAEILRDEGQPPLPQPLSASTRAVHHHTFSAPQLHLSIEGEGSPIVLSHALGLDLHLWDDVAARLARSHSVLRYDHRGHGASAAPRGPYSMDDLVDDAARIVREWGRGPVAFVGMSMGGMVGQGLAIRYPELVSAVVVANSAASYGEIGKAAWRTRIAAVEGGGMAAIADTVIARYLTEPYRHAHPETVAAMKRTLLADDPAAYVANCRAIESLDWLDRLAGVKTPMLVIAGGQDSATPPELSQAIAERVPGAELAVIEEAAHLSAAEFPQRFVDLVEGLPGPRARMIDKQVAGLAEALAGTADGSTVMIGGFGGAGQPNELIDALIEQGAKDLVVVNNNAGNGETGLAALLKAGRVRKIICSFPRQADSQIFDGLYRSGQLELELVPQGNLAERIRAAGAGIGGFFSPTGYGTELAKGKETREIGGRMYVLEAPIHADLALVKAERGDRWGNLVYRKTARNFGPIMAMAAKVTVASVHELVPLGGLDPEAIVTPGIFVQRVVVVPRSATGPAGFKQAA